jgi:hypothetical protein
MFSSLSLYVTDKSVASHRLAENLASRLTLDAEASLFYACISSDSGALLKHAPWYPKSYKPPRAPYKSELRELASWIVEKERKRSQLMEMRNVFPDMTLFDELIDFRHEVREGEHYDIDCLRSIADIG